MAFSLAGIIDVLPQLLGAVQIILYVALSWTFGSVAFFGMKKRIPFAVRMVAKLGTGFLCILAGLALGKYLPLPRDGLFQMLQLDLLMAGLAASALAGTALFLMTAGNAENEGKSVKRLEERVRLLEGALLNNRVPTIPENDAMKSAETALPGFQAKRASLKAADWEVMLEKDSRTAVVTLGAHTGEVKGIERAGRLRDPRVVAGAAIMIGIVAFSVLSFRGFPSMTEGIASMMGMSDEQFNSLVGGSELPEGCVATVRILMSQGVSVISNDKLYSDDSAKALFETATGRQVMLMYKTSYEGSERIVSITLPKDMDASNSGNVMENAEICSSTAGEFCDCVKIPELGNMPTGFIIAK